MAYGILPKPGSKYGPCAKECKHIDCKATREQAASLCRFCQKPIGYDTPYYNDPEPADGDPSKRPLVHGECYRAALESRREL